MSKKPGYKPKTGKYGQERFTYYGVAPDTFMGAMRTGKFQGKKISRRGSFIGKAGRTTIYSLAFKKSR